MEDHFINKFEKLWPEHSILYLDLDFQLIYKILSSDKLKNENPQTVWQVIHDWMNVDAKNRLTYFKILFKNCLQIESLQFKFVENNIFQSDIFRLLPLKFQQDLKKFINKKSLLVCIDSYYGSVQFYNPRHNSWLSSPVLLPLSNGQYYFELSLLGNMLYAFGGNNWDSKATTKMWSRDLSEPLSQWTSRADMKQCRKGFCSVVLNDTIYALGGVGTNYHSLSSCERYCSQLNEWSTVADMNIGRTDASAAVINGCIYVAGGWSLGAVLKSVSKYCPETDTWREVASMNNKRVFFALTPFAGRLWAIGGEGGGSQLLSSCESYDPVTDTWRGETPMKEGRCRHAAMEFNRELYVVSGWRKNKQPTCVERYAPIVDKWVEDSTLQDTDIVPHLLSIPPAYSSYFTTDSNQ